MSNCDSNLCKFLSEERVEWSFIQPRAPNHGGLWEAGVKAIKYHLRRVMANLRFTYEEFLTTLNQIEEVLNSRPLYPLSCDPDDFEALTPGHFLVGRPITAIAEPSLTEVSDNRLFSGGYVKSLVYADKPQTLDHLEDNIRRVIADIRPQMLEKVIENWTSRLDYIRASRGSHMPEIIFKM
ncbi:integrase catalytic domain-containing protein [Trichonephila clavipes]|nr:integrase catalytic domain-containing protein [Trichonephila clavipes]